MKIDNGLRGEYFTGNFKDLCYHEIFYTFPQQTSFDIVINEKNFYCLPLEIRSLVIGKNSIVVKCVNVIKALLEIWS